MSFTKQLLEYFEVHNKICFLERDIHLLIDRIANDIGKQNVVDIERIIQSIVLCNAKPPNIGKKLLERFKKKRIEQLNFLERNKEKLEKYPHYETYKTYLRLFQSIPLIWVLNEHINNDINNDIIEKIKLKLENYVERNEEDKELLHYVRHFDISYDDDIPIFIEKIFENYNCEDHEELETLSKSILRKSS